MNFLKQLFRMTLNSVPFGIALMLLVAGYIAVGSGVASVREALEMNEMQFFNWWPLKVLMGLLVVNLATVTWTRIPFTPPKYGVWCVHAGIIVLIFGMAKYYKEKVEGLALIYRNQTVDHFYDVSERALYTRLVGAGFPISWHPLEELPRFKAYANELGNASELDRDGLKGLEPFLVMPDKQTKKPVAHRLTDLMKLEGELKMDVVGYYPYAEIIDDFEAGDGGHHGPSGVRLSVTDPHTGREMAIWLVGSDAHHARTALEMFEFEHREVHDTAAVKALKEAAGRVHRLEVKVGDFATTMFVEPTKKYELGDSGYSIEIESFDPAFPAMNGEIVQVLTMMVRGPGEVKEFRRQLIPGREKPTDWLLGVEGAGPMGKRQTEPLDKELQISYAFEDPMRIMPRGGELTRKHLLVTTHDGDFCDIATGIDAPLHVTDFTNNKGHVTLAVGNASVQIDVERHEHLKRVQEVREVPKALRQKDAGQAGVKQVVMVRVSCGDWSQTVAVPYLQWVGMRENEWDGPEVEIPGTGGMKLQLQLGNRQYPLPAKLTLERFEAVPYQGAVGTQGMMRDFKSTLTLEDVQTGEKTVGVAHMNNPIYFRGGDWLFFQNAWDPEGMRYTVIGVGNRKGVFVMTLGCVMIIGGVLYAFYLKPVIIKRMKQRAIEEAKARTPAKREPAVAGVAS